MINWIKKNWTDPVWSKVFGGLILAGIMLLLTKIYHLIRFVIQSQIVQNYLKSFNTWISEESVVSNFTLLLILLFIGIMVTLALYNLTLKNWIGRTEKYYSSDKSFLVRGTYSLNLDIGTQARDNNEADFWWQQKTKTNRSIVPKNGAKFCVIGQSNKERFDKSELEKLEFSDTEIIANSNHSNRIPSGTQIAYKTKEGRYGIMKIKTYDYNLEIEFYTFKKEKE